MKKILQTITLVLLLLVNTKSNAKELKITASMKPLQSIVQNVLGDQGKVEVIVNNPNDSPHTYSLKPSDVKKLNMSDIIFYIDENMENFIKKLVSQKNYSQHYIAISSLDGIKLLSENETNFWANDHDNKDQSEVKHIDSVIDHHHHHHHGTDYHLWLDIDNVQIIATNIEKIISSLDPDNHKKYQENLRIFIEKLNELDTKIAQELKPYRENKFIVFHDAYQYFEKKYGLKSLGSILINPYVTPGAKKIQELRAAIKWQDVKCVFAEPQFPKKLVSLIIESTNAQTAVLDIEWGASDKNLAVKDAYFYMMENLANNMVNCFASNKNTIKDS